MEKTILHSSPITGTDQLITGIDTWIEIINVSKGYIELKYAYMNDEPVTYIDVDQEYRKFNLNETLIIDTLPESAREKYREMNMAFMQHQVFRNGAAEEVVAKFRELLEFPLHHGQTPKQKQDALNRIKAFADLKSTDRLSADSYPDLVLRLRRLYLVRKEDFLQQLRNILTSRTPAAREHLKELKKLYEQESDYDTFALTNIQSEKGRQQVGNRQTYDAAEKKLTDTKKTLVDEYLVDKTELDRLKGLEEPNAADIDRQKRRMLERLKNRNVEVDILTKLHEREANALTAKEKLTKKWEEFKKQQTAVKERVTNVDLYAASASYFVENSANYIAKRMFEKPPPTFGEMTGYLGKDLAETGVQLATTLLLGPFGASLAGPFIKEGFKALWGVEELEDPNIARFNTVNKKLDAITRQLDDVHDKLDGMLKRFDDVNESLGKLNASLRINLQKNQLEEKIQKVRAAMTNIKNLYENTFVLNDPLIDEIGAIQHFDGIFQGLIVDLLKVLWSPQCRLSLNGFHLDDSSQSGTFAYAVQELAKDPEIGDDSRFERIIDLMSPLTSDLLELCSDYLESRDTLAMVLRVYYTMIDYPDKSGTSNRQEQIFTNLRSAFNEVSCQLIRTHMKTVILTLEQHLAPSFRNMTLYNLYRSAKNAPAELDFTCAFGIETFEPAKRADNLHGRAVRYNYATRTFEHTPDGDYARFFLVPNPALTGSKFNGKGHALYCLNDDFDQSLIPIKIGAGLENDEIYLFGARGLAGYHFRVVPLNLESIQKKDTNAGTASYLGLFDQLWGSDQKFDIKDDRWVGLPVSFLRLVLRYPTQQDHYFRILQQNTATGQEVSLFHFSVPYSTYPDPPLVRYGTSISITFKRKTEKIKSHLLVRIGSHEYKIERGNSRDAIPELATANLEFKCDNGPKIWIDNRYTFASLRFSGDTEKLLPGTKLTSAGLLSKNKKYHLNIRPDESLTIGEGPHQTFWFAGIEKDSTAPLKGKLAVVDSRGRLVLYNDRGEVAWKSDNPLSHPKDGVYLHMQDDRNLVLYNRNDQPVWASDTNERNEHWRWYVGERLNKGTEKASGKMDQRYARLELQEDGNLVFSCMIYQKPQRRAGKWVASAKNSADTWQEPKKGNYAVLQPDGIIVVYNEQHKEVGHTPNSACKDLGKGAYIEVAISKNGVIVIDYVICLQVKTFKGDEKTRFWESVI